MKAPDSGLMAESLPTEEQSVPKLTSRLTSALQEVHAVREQDSDDEQLPTPSKLSKVRPWSSIELKPPISALSPSPVLLEPGKSSKDDTYVIRAPATPKRPYLASRGLSLQMPPRDISSSSTANLSTNLINRVPLSPKFDSPYGVASTVLPRRSRGMEFARSCTNLHHSTLAEQSSPDSSPVIGGRAMAIPQRKGFHNGSSSTSIIPDSPGSAPGSLWSTMGHADKPSISSSVSSVIMMDSDTASDSSDDEMMGHTEDDDTILSTPQAYKSGYGLLNPLTPGGIASPMDGVTPFSPVGPNLMSFQRARLRNGQSRKSSSSASGRSSMISPGPTSPPLLKSIESGLGMGYFHSQLAKKSIESRRESLSLGTSDLHISDGIDDDDLEGARISPTNVLGLPIPVTPIDERRNVIRRAVTRRGNLLVSHSHLVKSYIAYLRRIAQTEKLCQNPGSLARRRLTSRHRVQKGSGNNSPGTGKRPGRGDELCVLATNNSRVLTNSSDRKCWAIRYNGRRTI